MANLDVYPEIPSSSRASFRTVNDDDPTSTPRRTGTPAPTRHVDERSRLLDGSEDDVFVEHHSEQVVGRRRGPSTYAVISTGSTPGVDPTAVPQSNGGDICEPSIP